MIMTAPDRLDQANPLLALADMPLRDSITHDGALHPVVERALAHILDGAPLDTLTVSAFASSL